MKRIVTLVVLALFCLLTGLRTSAAHLPTAQPAPSTTATQPMLPDWELILLPNGLTTDTVSSLAVNPADAAQVWLGTHQGLFSSTDAGRNWQLVKSAPFDFIFEVVIAPQNPQQIYVRSWQLYRSDDGGVSWAALTTPSSTCGLALTGAAAQRIYARRCTGDQPPSIVRSDDGGQSWLTPTLLLTTTLDTLVVSPVDADLVVGADFDEIFYSRNGGATWTKAPVGVRYFGKPVFETQPPYGLYVGHWTGLLRTLDGGEHWQDSYASREFTALFHSPQTGAIVGGDATGAWQLFSTGDEWTATVWQAPLPLQALWHSPGDPSVVYARTPTGFWRMGPLTRPHTLFLPMIQQPTTLANSKLPNQPQTEGEAAQQALEQLNRYRQQVGVRPLQLHQALVEAAQNHAEYSVTNANDNAAWANGPHGEVEGKPGFTGKYPSDRAIAAGYPTGHPWGAGAEIKHGVGDPIASVDGWMATIYHRVIPLDPNASYVGYGLGVGNVKSDVMDFGSGPTTVGQWSSGTPYALAYPATGQTDVPTTWDGGEWPDPLPPNAARPVGYPFTLQGVGGSLQIEHATLLDSNGTAIAVHPNPPDCHNSCYALIAVEPLQPATTYTVQARGTVAGIPFAQSWIFTTGDTTTVSGAGLPKATPGPATPHPGATGRAGPH